MTKRRQSKSSSTSASPKRGGERTARTSVSLSSPEVEEIQVIKRERLQRAFDLLAHLLVIVFVVVIVYYIGIMLLPHLSPIFWATILAILLAKPVARVEEALLDLDARLSRYFTLILTASGIGYLSALIMGSVYTSVVATAFLILWIFLLCGTRRYVATVIIIVLAVTFLAIPTYLIVKNCIDESKVLVVKVRTFVDNNPHFQSLLDDFGNSAIYRTAVTYAKSWGIDLPPFDPAQVKLAIANVSLKFSDFFRNALSSIVTVISDSFRFLVSFATFASCLFYFLNSHSAIASTLNDVSPFGAAENRKLLKSLKSSITSVFACSMAVGLAHTFGTYVVFSFAGIDLCLMLSCLAGFAAMLPIFSSWVVWVPTAVGLLFTGSTFQAIVIICVELFLDFAVDSAIYSVIQGNTWLIGTSIAMGLYTFGVVGLVLGPLLASLLLTVLDMYRGHQAEMLAEQAKRNTWASEAGVSNGVMSPGFERRGSMIGSGAPLLYSPGRQISPSLTSSAFAPIPIAKFATDETSQTLNDEPYASTHLDFQSIDESRLDETRLDENEPENTIESSDRPNKRTIPDIRFSSPSQKQASAVRNAVAVHALSASTPQKSIAPSVQSPFLRRAIEWIVDTCTAALDTPEQRSSEDASRLLNSIEKLKDASASAQSKPKAKH